jgi:HAD superfamily hydrolase (TIGR01509 family)
MRTGTRGLVIFDAFNTLVTARPGSANTFLAGLSQAGLEATTSMLARLQAASEGFDHSAWSGSRQSYVNWATETLRTASYANAGSDVAPSIVPALEQLYQAPMVTMPGAVACLRMLRTSGFAIAVCSNWGWDLRADLEGVGIVEEIDLLVASAQVGFRKPHPRIYQSTLGLAGFAAEEAIFVGDSLRTDILGPRNIGIRSILLAPVAVNAFRGPQVRSLVAAAELLIDGQSGYRMEAE